MKPPLCKKLLFYLVKDAVKSLCCLSEASSQTSADKLSKIDFVSGVCPKGTSLRARIWLIFVEQQTKNSAEETRKSDGKPVP